MKTRIREAQALQFAAILVASPRYMGAFALGIGIDLLNFYPWFAHVEVWSGLAMAILEGLAIAFVFRKWRSMRAGTAVWRILLALMLALMVALPLTAAPYLVASQLDLPIQSLMPAYLQWMWSFLVAAIAPLVLAAVGYADREPVVRASKPASNGIEPALERNVCPHCDKKFKSAQGKAAHSRWCKEKEANNQEK